MSFRFFELVKCIYSLLGFAGRLEEGNKFFLFFLLPVGLLPFNELVQIKEIFSLHLFILNKKQLKQKLFCTTETDSKNIWKNVNIRLHPTKMTENIILYILTYRYRLSVNTRMMSAGRRGGIAGEF